MENYNNIIMQPLNEAALPPLDVTSALFSLSYIITAAAVSSSTGKNLGVSVLVIIILLPLLLER